MNARSAEEPAGWEFKYKSLSLNVYVFNPGWGTPTVVSNKSWKPCDIEKVH